MKASGLFTQPQEKKYSAAYGGKILFSQPHNLKKIYHEQQQLIP
jgi:hypothetical protein